MYSRPDSCSSFWLGCADAADLRRLPFVDGCSQTGTGLRRRRTWALQCPRQCGVRAAGLIRVAGALRDSRVTGDIKLMSMNVFC